MPAPAKEGAASASVCAPWTQPSISEKSCHWRASGRVCQLSGLGLRLTSCRVGRVESFTVRDALGTDEEFLREMQYQSIFVPPGEPPVPSSLVDSDELARYYRGFGDRVGDVGRIAELGSGRPVGAAWVRQLIGADPGFGYVDDRTPEVVVAVTEEHRGRGIGTALLTSLFDDVPRCCLSVDARNPALRLYESLGFKVHATDGQSLTMLRKKEIGGGQDIGGSRRAK